MKYLYIFSTMFNYAHICVYIYIYGHETYEYQFLSMNMKEHGRNMW